MPPLFSIIIPSYNSRRGLGESFASLIGQPPDLFEYWVIDGESTDGTQVWLGSRNEANFHWISEKDSGVYDAMNKGIGLAQGRFLLFLGAGDCLLPGSLQRMAHLIGQNPSTRPRLIYGDVKDMQSGQPFTSGRYSKMKLCRKNICHQGIFYERSIFDLLGGYELRYPVMADWAFNLRCFGDPRIKKLHVSQYVAEFEGGGLCSHTPDVPFAQDRQRLIAERIGPLHAFHYRLEAALHWRLKRMGMRF